MFHKQLTWACDLIILNACCLTVLQAWLVGIDWIWGISLLNCIAVITLRQWLMKSLQIPWLFSLLNQGLKRITDIIASILFLTTLFPIIIVIQTFVIKSSKNCRNPLFSAVDVYTNEGRHFVALVFSNYSQPHGHLIGMTPVIFQLLTGTISLSDITSLSVKQVEPDVVEDISTEEFSDSPQDSSSDSIAYNETKG